MTGLHHRPSLLSRADAALIFNVNAACVLWQQWRTRRREAAEGRERATRLARDAQVWTLDAARDPATDDTVPVEDLDFIKTLRKLGDDPEPEPSEGVFVPGQREPEPDWLAEQLQVVYGWANSHEARLATLGHVDEQVAA